MTCSIQRQETSDELWLEPDYLDSVEVELNKRDKQPKVIKRELPNRLANNIRRPVYEMIIELLDRLSRTLKMDVRRKREQANGVIQII